MESTTRRKLLAHAISSFILGLIVYLLLSLLYWVDVLPHQKYALWMAVAFGGVAFVRGLLSMRKGKSDKSDQG